MSLNFSDMIDHITLKLSDMIDPVTMICDFMQSFISLWNVKSEGPTIVGP